MGVRWPAGRWQMAISPDSQWLVTGGSDGTVRIWDAATGQARALMRVDNMTFVCAGLAQEDVPWEARAASAFSTSCALVRRVDRSPRPVSRQGPGRNTTGARPAHRPRYDPLPSTPCTGCCKRSIWAYDFTHWTRARRASLPAADQAPGCPRSAASSTNTSGPRRRPVQDQWPSSGTPTADPG